MHAYLHVISLSLSPFDVVVGLCMILSEEVFWLLERESNAVYEQEIELRLTDVDLRVIYFFSIREKQQQKKKENDVNDVTIWKRNIYSKLLLGIDVYQTFTSIWIGNIKNNERLWL